MLSEILRHIKPGAPVRLHVLLAALIWSIVGVFLMVNGYLMLSVAEGQWLTVVAMVLGTLKSRLLLDRTAKRNGQRLATLADGTCIGAVYPAKMWLLIGLMIAAGRLLRFSGVLPLAVVGLIYCAVGWALFVSSRIMWRMWYKTGS